MLSYVIAAKFGKNFGDYETSFFFSGGHILQLHIWHLCHHSSHIVGIKLLAIMSVFNYSLGKEKLTKVQETVGGLAKPGNINANLIIYSKEFKFDSFPVIQNCQI